MASATTRWQASAISQPPPMAKPLTAAMTGLSMLARLVSPANPFFGTHMGFPEAE